MFLYNSIIDYSRQHHVIKQIENVYLYFKHYSLDHRNSFENHNCFLISSEEYCILQKHFLSYKKNGKYEVSSRNSFKGNLK